MEGKYQVVNSEKTLHMAQEWLSETFNEHKYARVQVDAGKRTLSQNALKSVWYAQIAKNRADVTAKDVERECKYKYGLPILRREPMHEYVFANSVDKLDYDRKLKVMDCFSVTSIMSVEQLNEYMTMMQNDYPYLSNKRK